MKSTNDKKKPFSIEDFEKGLMLAGYISPNSISDLKEREELEKYEKETNIEKSAQYFKRAVLAAEIVSQLHNEPTFGSVKFQKLVFLCENAAQMDLNHRYSKQAAGPFDNKFMHSIYAEFKKQKWFNSERITENKITRYKYSPAINAEKYKTYYESYFKEDNDKIQLIITLFKKQKTDYIEISATIFACWLEILEEGKTLSKENLLQRFYNWAPPKRRFAEIQILSNWEWMKENGLTPTEI